jgi:hypothetical protein
VTDAERAYWSIVAQILPVLGLTLVLEARLLVQAYQQHASSLVSGRTIARRWQLGFLTVSGLVIAVGLLTALSALSRDVPPGAVLARVLEVNIAAAVGVLLVNPLVSVVLASEPKWVRRALNWSPKRRVDQWRVLRQLSRLGWQVARLRSTVGDDLREMEAMVLENRSLIQTIEAEGIEHPVLPSARVHLEKGQAYVEDLRRRHRTLLVKELNLRTYRREVQSALALASGDLPSLEVTGDPLLGWVSRVRDPRQAPDDGGFLSDLPEPRVPKLPDTDRLITDPVDFYAEG